MGKSLISSEDEVFGIYHDVIEFVSTAPLLDAHVRNAQRLAREKLNREISLIIMNESLLNEYLLYIKKENIPFVKQESGQGFRVNAGATIIAGIPVLVSPSVGGVNFMAGPDMFSVEILSCYKTSNRLVNSANPTAVIESLRNEIHNLKSLNANLNHAYENAYKDLFMVRTDCESKEQLIASLKQELAYRPRTFWEWLFGRRK